MAVFHFDHWSLRQLEGRGNSLFSVFKFLLTFESAVMCWTPQSATSRDPLRNSKSRMHVVNKNAIQPQRHRKLPVFTLLDYVNTSRFGPKTIQTLLDKNEPVNTSRFGPSQIKQKSRYRGAVCFRFSDVHRFPGHWEWWILWNSHLGRSVCHIVNHLTHLTIKPTVTSVPQK